MLTKIFGVALDPTDNPQSVMVKRAYINAFMRHKIEEPNFLDPYDALTTNVLDLGSVGCTKIGKVPVESWLTPKPMPEDLVLVTPENYTVFLDSNGCLEYTEAVTEFVKANVLPERSVMFGVDHSLTGGVLRALTSYYDVEDVSVFVLDSHFDAIENEFRSKLALYVKETSPEIFKLAAQLPPEVDLHRLNVSAILHRKEIYDAATFLRYILEENTIRPQNLMLIGVTDYPYAKLREIDNPGVQSFIKRYLSFERKGVMFVPKQKIREQGVKTSLLEILKNLKSPYAYISIDMDIGSLSAVYAARTMNTIGLREEEILELVRLLMEVLTERAIRLIGFDIMEIDTHLAGTRLRDGSCERTYDITSNMVKLLMKT